MKYKVSELEGALLDAAVAKSEGRGFTLSDDGSKLHRVSSPGGFDQCFAGYAPSSDWYWGGPILEREGICPFCYTHHGETYWAANTRGANPFGAHGTKSLLVAAMRCFVASKFGEEVEL